MPAPRAVTNRSASAGRPGSRARFAQVALDPAPASPPNGTSRSLLPLPMHAQHTVVQAHLEGLQRDQLADAQSARIHQLEHRAVAQAERRVDVAARPAGLRPPPPTASWKARRALRRVEPERRIGRDAPLAQAVLVEALEGRDHPRCARRPSLAGSHEGEKIRFRARVISLPLRKARNWSRSVRYEPMVFFDRPSSSQSASQNASSTAGLTA